MDFQLTAYLIFIFKKEYMLHSMCVLQFVSKAVHVYGKNLLPTMGFKSPVLTTVCSIVHPEFS